MRMNWSILDMIGKVWLALLIMLFMKYVKEVKSLQLLPMVL
jgi:hypothetical protein